MKSLKDQKGITLVALVITIIVLLILAGISLSLVLGDNGILGRASSSSNTQRAASARDQLELKFADLAAEYYQAKYVNNNTSAANPGAYIASYADKTLPDGSSYTITSATGGYTVTLRVKNGLGNADGNCTGSIDSDGKWTQPVDITTITAVSGS